MFTSSYAHFNKCDPSLHQAGKLSFVNLMPCITYQTTLNSKPATYGISRVLTQTLHRPSFLVLNCDLQACRYPRVKTTFIKPENACYSPSVLLIHFPPFLHPSSAFSFFVKAFLLTFSPQETISHFIRSQKNQTKRLVVSIFTLRLFAELVLLFCPYPFSPTSPPHPQVFAAKKVCECNFEILASLFSTLNCWRRMMWW